MAKPTQRRKMIGKPVAFIEVPNQRLFGTKAAAEYLGMAKNPGRKGACMAVNREIDRNGNERVVVSKRWPDGSRFRRYYPNPTIAKKVLARIEESIAMATWQRLKEDSLLNVRPALVGSRILPFRNCSDTAPSPRP
jgi:hypothetical protein